MRCDITVSVCITHNESGLLHNYGVWLESLLRLAPISQYEHNGKDAPVRVNIHCLFLVALIMIPSRGFRFVPNVASKRLRRFYAY
jgi:hypothetical protein